MAARLVNLLRQNISHPHVFVPDTYNTIDFRVNQPSPRSTRTVCLPLKWRAVGQKLTSSQIDINKPRTAPSPERQPALTRQIHRLRANEGILKKHNITLYFGIAKLKELMHFGGRYWGEPRPLCVSCQKSSNVNRPIFNNTGDQENPKCTGITSSTTRKLLANKQYTCPRKTLNQQGR